MNTDPSKLRQQHQSETSNELQMGQTAAQGQQFDSPEEMIRFDSKQTKVPPAIADRLAGAITLEPKAPVPWWKRLFKR